MVSSPHEAMHHLLRKDPGVFARTIRDLGLPFPDPLDVSLLPTDVTEIEPLERRLDTLLRIETEDDTILLLVEAQRGHDDAKRSSWAYYLAHLHAKYKIEPVLLIICEDTDVADWATGPFTIGPPQWPSLTVRPLVFGPHNVPAVTDLETAVKDVPLATLSAITHVNNPAIGDIMKPLAAALRTLDEEDRRIFAELTELGLGKNPAANIWRQLMAVDLSFFRSETSQRLRAEGKAEGVTEGKAEGKAEAILEILAQRHITVPHETRDRITACADQDQLTTWLRRAISIESINDLLA